MRHVLAISVAIMLAWSPFAAYQAPAPPAAPSVINSSAISVAPGQNIQSAVNAAPVGATIWLRAGIHRLQTVSPKMGQTFVGETGTILSGAKLLSGFTQTAGNWWVSGQTQEGVVHGECQAVAPRCNRPEELFVDNVRLTPVDSLAALAPGKWFFDYEADRIYLRDTPTGHMIETSTIPTAFNPTADYVTLIGLTIEKYASVAQSGAVSAENRTGWTVLNCDVRFNHGVGTRIGHRFTALLSKFNYNGQLGIGGVGDDVLVDGNEIAYNNAAHFEAGWEGGGSKFVQTLRLVVRNNNAHHNEGPALWADINNYLSLFENNTACDNAAPNTAAPGIMVEISYNAIIRNNVVCRNGLTFPVWAVGAGILIAASPNVEVYGNTVDGNGDGIIAMQQNRLEYPDPRGPHQISNLYVHHNTIRNSQGWSLGFVQDIGDLTYFTGKNNRFVGNVVTTTAPAPFTWMNQDATLAQWQAYGQDTVK